MERVQHGSRDECRLVRDPQMTDRIEAIGKNNPLYSHISRRRQGHGRTRRLCLPYCPCAPGRQARTSWPIPALLSHGSCPAHTSCRTAVVQGPPGGPLFLACRCRRGRGTGRWTPRRRPRRRWGWTWWLVTSVQVQTREEENQALTLGAATRQWHL
jgi:hypothetical protein